MQFILQYVTNRFITKKESEMQEIEALAAGMILLGAQRLFYRNVGKLWRRVIYQKIVSML
jgi:hypothetical protein